MHLPSNNNDNVASAKREIGVAIIIVTYGHDKTLHKTIDAIVQDKKTTDKLILIDNHPDHKCAKIAKNYMAVDKVVESDNLGFGAGCNIGASFVENSELLYFINPDTVPQKNFLTEIKKAYFEKPEWSAWMSLLVLDDGTINSAGTEVHLSGLSWAKGLGSRIQDYNTPTEVNAISGACFAIKQNVWAAVGGFTEEYFLYYEDTELSAKLQLHGMKMGLWPASKVLHDYNFENGDQKWFYLERNRYLYILTCWPVAVILVLSPILLLSDIGLWLMSLLQHRFVLRVRAARSFITLLPRLLVIRNKVQSGRSATSHSVLNHLTSKLDNPNLGFMSNLQIISTIFGIYKRLVLFLLP